ncbi:TolC family protein [Fulvivirga sediminis]|uniref:TolC family protein n=1 Tax=Fulvivirga sediminis TaxID=2803949 RepID=A0A937K0J8_9BACT|nr:TolC family protein [Fulvivirga sediminis]MBL3658433.1 TolC family protein [Fulvivirga sediminis]
MNNNKIYKGFFLLMLLGLAPYWSQVRAQHNTVTLEEAKKSALQYSNDIKNGKLSIEQAEAIKSQALSNYFPTVQALGVGIYGFDDFVEPIPPLLNEGIDNGYMVSAVASEVIYAGGKVRTGNELAAVQIEASKIRAEQSVDSVILLTEQKYWQLVQLQEQQKVIAASKVYLNELIKQQQDLLDAGLIPSNQLLRVKVNRSRLLLQESKVNNMRKLALLDFALYTGISYDTTLVAQDSLHAVAAPNATYNAPALNLENNSNYQLVEKSIKAAQLQTKMAKADRLPQLAVGISTTRLGVFDVNLSTGFETVGFGVLSIPISNWWGSAKHRIREREIQEKIAANNFRDIQDKITVGIMQSWYNLQDAYKQIEFAQENLSYADENLKVQRDNYTSGLNNLTDLLDAQKTQQQAKTELVNAYAQYEINEIIYLHRTDQIDTVLMDE